MKHLKEFISYAQFERRLSDSTINGYITDLKRFETFLNDSKKDITQINIKLARKYIVSLSKSNIDPLTIRRYISTINAFYKFLIGQKDSGVTNNPFKLIDKPKVRKKLPRYLSIDQVNDLLDPKYFDDDFVGIRDRFILLMFYHTGIRMMELINIKVNDVNMRREEIKIIGKGNQERLAVCLSLEEEFDKYMAVRDKIVPKLKYLFITETGNKMYSMLVNRIITPHLERLGIYSKQGPHILRHTFATHMINNGANLMAIKELLGHKSVSSTKIYTHLETKTLINQYSKAFDGRK